MSKSQKHRPVNDHGSIEEFNEDGFVIEKATEENQTEKPERETTKTRQRSQIDTIKRFQKWIKDLETLKMVTPEEQGALKHIAETMTLRWIGGKLIE